MADQAQRRTLDEIEQQITSDRVRNIDRIDQKIAADRALYLRATWAGHDGEAEQWEFEVDRLLDLRTLVERGLLPTAAELDALS